jgi:predicted nucleic acid-binding protein
MKPKRLAADTTSILSFLIGGKAVQVFDSPDVDSFVTTEFNIQEVRHMIPKLAAEYHLDGDGLREVLEKLTRTKLRVLAASDYSSGWKQAQRVMSKIDEKDTDLLALALSLDCPVWTRDSDFREPSVTRLITSYSTRELLKILYNR